MSRIRRLVRLPWTLACIWSWRPPAGVSLYATIRWAEAEVRVLLDSGQLQVARDDTWAGLSRAEVRGVLDALAVTLAGGVGRVEDDGWSSATVVQAGLHFRAGIERQRRAIAARRAAERAPRRAGTVHDRGGRS